jgi:adenylylsulfate kinase-like enzyme/2-polyprenyl-3-methyl-5-hydroxy-6-metoxy-1,4-benzoquinol methylase
VVDASVSGGAAAGITMSRAGVARMTADSPSPNAEGGVIWITGYSGAGKTTVGRKVERQFRQHGLPTVFLDGDDLRRIFSRKWGYGRADRLELAKVYLRLCSHLASQQITVIISAIAMYADVYEWVVANIPRSLQVYLRVPEEERLRRDSAGKNVYKAMSSADPLGYDEPVGADLVIDNHGEVDPDKAAARIVDSYLKGSHTQGGRVADHGKGAYWDAFYRRGEAVQEPSPFAIHVAQKVLNGRIRLLDIGCGNGRDSAYFSQLGHEVWALDASRSAIDLCREFYAHVPIEFRHGTIESLLDVGNPPKFDVVYCRFVLHAMTEKEEAALCRTAHGLLRDRGMLLIECRSVNDPMIRLGEVISPTERVHGHYRRFIMMEQLIQHLEASGFAIETALESKGLAVFKDEDPVVVRVFARKKQAGHQAA